MSPQSQPPAPIGGFPSATLRITSTTDPIQRSRHRLHLRPMQNGKQTVASYRMTLAPRPAPLIEYEDVFGNMTARFEMDQCPTAN